MYIQSSYRMLVKCIIGTSGKLSYDQTISFEFIWVWYLFFLGFWVWVWILCLVFFGFFGLGLGRDSDLNPKPKCFLGKTTVEIGQTTLVNTLLKLLMFQKHVLTIVRYFIGTGGCCVV